MMLVEDGILNEDEAGDQGSRSDNVYGIYTHGCLGALTVIPLSVAMRSNTYSSPKSGNTV